MVFYVGRTRELAPVYVDKSSVSVNGIDVTESEGRPM